jgi:DNA-binding response OmpR family regulator
MDMKREVQAPTAPNAVRTFSDALVMMVDDEPLTVDVARVHLLDAGYSRFTSTTDPFQALEMIERARPDVLLLDLMMPGLSGLEILARMEEQDFLRHVPTIMLTGSRDPANKLKALSLGVTEFLMKPVDASELVLRLRNTLAAKAYWESSTPNARRSRGLR